MKPGCLLPVFLMMIPAFSTAAEISGNPAPEVQQIAEDGPSEQYAELYAEMQKMDVCMSEHLLGMRGEAAETLRVQFDQWLASPEANKALSAYRDWLLPFVVSDAVRQSLVAPIENEQLYDRLNGVLNWSCRSFDRNYSDGENPWGMAFSSVENIMTDSGCSSLAKLTQLYAQLRFVHVTHPRMLAECPLSSQTQFLMQKVNDEYLQNPRP